MQTQEFYVGDNQPILAACAANSFDSLVCDPPAGISFMNRAWDTDKGGRDHWIAWLQERAVEMLRVLKPGAFGLVWALPKTSHWTAMALENAGFRIHDRVSHLFGSGFPKNANTQLKPAMEDWWLVQKPFSGSAANCVQQHGTGYLRIDECRVPAPEGLTGGGCMRTRSPMFMSADAGVHHDTGNCDGHPSGRWPANVLHDGSEAVLAAFAEFGETTRPDARTRKVAHQVPGENGVYNEGWVGVETTPCYSDTGTAARFFYSAKVSPRDKQEGCEHLLWQRNPANPFGYDAIDQAAYDALPERERARGNVHPTVKNTELMRYLVRLITPPGGRVLDPFTGSGSTQKACVLEGLTSVGIDLCAEAVLIAKARCAFAALPQKRTRQQLKESQLLLVA